MIQIEENISLKDYSYMKLGGIARYLTKPTTIDEFMNALSWAKAKKVPLSVIGSGANIVFKDEGYNGLIIVMSIKGFEVMRSDESGATIRISAGEDWDESVKKTVEMGLSGIETLSLIPGTAGSAPVQNIGAYGEQIADVITEVGIYDLLLDKRMSLSREECRFRYRESRFNREDKGRFVVLDCTLRLSRTVPEVPYYKDIELYFKQKSITAPTVVDFRNAVVEIRTRKLPNMHDVANCGSFFYNPIIEQYKLSELQARYPDIKHNKTDDGNLKLYAGQLIELAGFKGIIDSETGMGTWPSQALVVVNYHASSTQDLLTFKQKIVDKVQQMFGVTLVQEPDLI